jgi:hypothetical protein
MQGVGEAHGQELPHDDACDKDPDVDVKAHNAQEQRIDENQKEGTEQAPEEAEGGILVSDFYIAFRQDKEEFPISAYISYEGEHGSYRIAVFVGFFGLILFV